ncbi:MAG: PD-(D/E)XK nuclease family protein [Paludibacteraceae bacterium]|nr:PD-(D/E)XK nuclease family protein [Paludibacteraceae bacterium]
MGAVPFLQLVAEDLTAKYGGELSDLTVVFPNNRARLFFNNYLVKSVDKPIWSPSYMTIQDMFASCTNLKVADEPKLICDLFKAYSAHIDWEELGVEPETMDSFYFWGEVILSDFEDVDNNLVPAKMLFKNMVELSKMEDDFSFLSEDQIASLQRFFHNFSVDQKSLLKRKFMALWNALLPMYNEFRERLRSQGLAYGGMLHRIVVDEVLRQKGVEPFPSAKYVFVGFNVLNKCEIELFSRLRKADKALFYWDTDDFYMNMPDVRHEAATFMSQNLEKFPNELPRSVLNVFRNTSKHFSYISSSTDNAQAKYLNDFLASCKEKGFSDSDTAVVLCDESLLLPVLHSIPPCVDDLNITMGLPLIQTPVYALVKVLVEMQCNVSINAGKQLHSVPFRLIRETLCNPYVQIAFEGSAELYDKIVKEHKYFPTIDYLRGGNDSLELLFSFVDANSDEASSSMLKWLVAILKKVATYYRKGAADPQDDASPALDDAIYDPLYKEALFRTYTVVNRLLALSENGDLQVNVQTLCKLLERMLSTVSVPFSGEPVKGMQVMGFLETRNLDFKNVVMLSVNEGVLPKGGGESSFIPHSLRHAFGMTTIEHKNSLYAYYFYRLLQRVENATFLYCTATNGGSKGQMSRFLMQLLAETDIEVDLQDLRSDIEVSPTSVFEVAKTEGMIKKLRHTYDKASNPSASILSPSMLNTYISCQLKFYFSYIMGLKEPEELEDEADNRLLGLVLHAAMEEIYGRFKEKYVEEEDLRQLLEQEKIEGVVDNAFRREYFKTDENAHIDYSGQQLLLKMAVLAFVKNVLSIDLQNRVPFKIVGVETKEITHEFVVDGMRFTLGGIIDRLQEEGQGIYRVVDYKTGGIKKNSNGTGSSKVSFPDISILFEGDNPDRERYMPYALQVMLYAYLCTVEKGKKTIPSLLYVRYKDGLKNLFMGDGKEKDEISMISPDLCEAIERNLTELLRGMFDLNTPFVQTSNANNCEYCPYIEICKGKKDSDKKW